MKKIINRLVEYIECKGISFNAFDKSIDASNGYIGKQIKNNASIGGDVIEKISCIYADLNIDWLITGNGKMLRTDLTPLELKEFIPEERGIAVSHLSDIGSSHKIPLVEVAVVAGFGNARFAIGEGDVKEWYVIPKFKDRKIDFMIEVSGSSMYPKYNSGDVVACTILRESQFIQWNKVHIIGTEEQGILIKRIKKGPDENHLLLISDNKDYDPFVISLSEITGIALVVGVIRLE